MRSHADVVSLGHSRDSEQLANSSAMCDIALCYVHAARFEVWSTFLSREQALASLMPDHEEMSTEPTPCRYQELGTYRNWYDSLLIEMFVLFNLCREEWFFNKEQFDSF